MSRISKIDNTPALFDTIFLNTGNRTVSSLASRERYMANEYDSLGEEFENNEHRLFGDDGFETAVNKVADIEKSLNIYELAQFTPKI